MTPKPSVKRGPTPKSSSTSTPAPAIAPAPKSNAAFRAASRSSSSSSLSFPSQSAKKPTDSEVAGAASLFDLLGDQFRLAICVKLCEGPLRVTDIVSWMEMSSAAVAYHLRLLSLSQLLKAEKRGSERWYGIADPRVRQVLAALRVRGS